MLRQVPVQSSKLRTESLARRNTDNFKELYRPLYSFNINYHVRNFATSVSNPDKVIVSMVSLPATEQCCNVSYCTPTTQVRTTV